MPRPDADLDQWITLSEARAHEANVLADEAFVTAMQRAIKRGREKMPPLAGHHFNEATGLLEDRT